MEVEKKKHFVWGCGFAVVEFDWRIGTDVYVLALVRATVTEAWLEFKATKLLRCL